MYNCNNCGRTVGPRIRMQKFTTYKPNGNIEKEYPVCPECRKVLEEKKLKP